MKIPDLDSVNNKFPSVSISTDISLDNSSDTYDMNSTPNDQQYIRVFQIRGWLKRGSGGAAAKYISAQPRVNYFSEAELIRILGTSEICVRLTAQCGAAKFSKKTKQ
ncbi:hypothetical protein RclHR1_32220003 [Rhizophagus clarus]|uniref:Uncharacterized protein n=1 Tax=Rhizophagus clarus TaxID=94130 RepID=A0A2Z6Q593_9GLOM|nr:hypothetical protein RclHR1_11740006 [Rhizophagus clarus]GBB98434.1 hypothetical protein RclHR1_32220003 [Rhizophagus clarus]